MWITTRNFALLILLLLLPIELVESQTLSPRAQQSDRAAEELESIIAEAPKLDDKLASINVKCRAAALLSLRDPARSEAIFLEAWKSAKQQFDEDSDKERAANIVLKYLFPRNPKLAGRLLEEESKPEDLPVGRRASGRDPSVRRLAKLASALVERDPTAASRLLERVLSAGVTPAALASLSRLRERDPLLSNYVVSQGLERVKAQPTLVSLSGLYLLSSYVFPESYTFSGSTDVGSSLESLQFEYFSTTYDVLRISLSESEPLLVKNQQYSPADLRLRLVYQGLTARVLAALAPRYQPSLAPELNGLAQKLSTQLPASAAQMARFTAARLSGDQTSSMDPEFAIPVAISNGDFQEASRLVDSLKSEDLRKTYSQLLVRTQAKFLLANAELLNALSFIRKIEDPNARLMLYCDAARIANKKGDTLIARSVVDEARALIPHIDRNGLHARALLSFAAQLALLDSRDEAADVLHSAVVTINSLPKKNAEVSEATKSSTEAAWAEVNDPRSLIDDQEFDRAFSSMGTLDLDLTIIEARKIEAKAVQLMARLGSIEEIIRIAARKSRSPQNRSASLPLPRN